MTYKRPPCREAFRHGADQRLNPVRLGAEELLLDLGALAGLPDDGVLHGATSA
jgi:hypothetical protein